MGIFGGDEIGLQRNDAISISWFVFLWSLSPLIIFIIIIFVVILVIMVLIYWKGYNSMNIICSLVVLQTLESYCLRVGTRFVILGGHLTSVGTWAN